MILEKVKEEDVKSVTVGRELAGSWQGTWLAWTSIYWSASQITVKIGLVQRYVLTEKGIQWYNNFGKL